MTTKGIYNTLVTQLDKLARHNRQGSFRTKDRYYEAVKRFCAYLAAHYHLQKLENINGNHLVSYVLYLQEQGKSASTIKTDLSAIRFFHDKMSQPHYALPGNEDLGVALERRRFGQQDRTWTNPEFGKLIGRAMAEEREDYILALYLARYAGLRIHECFRMDTAAAERALRESALTVKGKGGKVRIVPIEDDRITMMLQRLLEKTERGHKLLVPDGVPTDRAINGMQQFILRHRDAICDPTAPDRRITFHGLRHPYVKHTTKIFSLRLMDFQAQAYPDARRKTRGACQLLRGGQSRSPVRPLCNRERFSYLPPQSKMSWILYAISIRLSGYTSTRSISSSASSVVSVSASKIALDASMRLSCRACSSCFCFACANTAA